MSNVVPPAELLYALRLTSQTPNAGGAATNITFDSYYFHQGITAQGSFPYGSFALPTVGFYRLSYSLNVGSTDNQNHSAAIWLQINGSNIPASAVNTFTIVPGIANYSTLETRSIIVQCQNPGDAISLWWAGSSTSMQLFPVTAQTGPPAIPNGPSATLSINKISR